MKIRNTFFGLVCLTGVLLANKGIAQGNFSTGFDMFFIGDARVILDRSCGTPMPGVSFVHVHEDETTAVEVMKQFIADRKRGCFTTIQCQQKRMISFRLGDSSYSFDPNRIFTPAGLEATLRKNGAYTDSAANKVAALALAIVRNHVDSQNLVVALHNNSENGGLTIKSYQKGGIYAKEAKNVFANKAQDVDDFILTTDPLAFNFLKSKGFNVLLQASSATDDGSLSVYAQQKGIAYINIEAQLGHAKQQKAMLSAVMEYIDNYYQ
jgi:hypothetical protein